MLATTDMHSCKAGLRQLQHIVSCVSIRRIDHVPLGSIELVHWLKLAALRAHTPCEFGRVTSRQEHLSVAICTRAKMQCNCGTAKQQQLAHLLAEALLLAIKNNAQRAAVFLAGFVPPGVRWFHAQVCIAASHLQTQHLCPSLSVVCRAAERSRQGAPKAHQASQLVIAFRRGIMIPARVSPGGSVAFCVATVHCSDIIRPGFDTASASVARVRLQAHTRLGHLKALRLPIIVLDVPLRFWAIERVHGRQ
jgi:hypothetical protein